MVLLATHDWSPQTDAGVAPPVAVLVHGIAGWWRTWWRVGPALAEHGYRAVAVDLRGHGGSAPIEGAVTRDELARDLVETIEALGVAPVEVLIGHSLGAAVAIELAHVHPDLVRRVVLEDPPGSDRSEDFPFQERFEAEVRAAIDRPEEEIARSLEENPAWLPEDARHNVEGQARCDLEGITESLRRGMGSRVPGLVPTLAVPALYLLAAEGRSAIDGVPRRRLLAGVPAGSTAIELDSGHVIHRDRFDDYLAIVLEWLAAPAQS